jgi:hypothetical protein
VTAQTPHHSAFEEAVAEVGEMMFRSDIRVHQIASPEGLAPHSYALAAFIRPDDAGNSEYGTGRLVLLYDPEEPAAWGGPWRIVAFAQAPLEPEIGTDPLLADVAWSWLIDALDSRDASYHAASGTSTKTHSKGFGSLADEGEGAQIELRASWSPAGHLPRHVEAWAELVGMLAGLPPGSEDIAVFGARKGKRA